MTLAGIDVSGLLELVWVAPLCAVGVTISFSLCVLGATRSTDARRVGDGTKGALWFALATVAGLTITAAAVAGILLIAGVWGGD